MVTPARPLEEAGHVTVRVTCNQWHESMNLHEYQSKQLFADYGLPVSKGFAVDTPEEAAEACKKIGGDMWVVKAQVHAGGRGKAGGVKLIKDPEEAKTFAESWLGKNLVTFQTDEKGQPVTKILVETCTDIANELYLGAVVDRGTQRVVFMASTEGGVEIEKVAEETPRRSSRPRSTRWSARSPTRRVSWPSPWASKAPR